MRSTKGLRRPVDCCTILYGQQGLGHQQQSAMAIGQEWSELLKAADVQTLICAKFSRIGAKFRLLETKLVKKRNTFHVFASLTCVMAFLAHFFAQVFY